MCRVIHRPYTIQLLQLLSFVGAEPMDLSKLPLRKAQIARIHFKCENCETAWRVMKSESSIREVNCTAYK